MFDSSTAAPRFVAAPAKQPNQPWTHLTHAEPGTYIVQRTSLRPHQDASPHPDAFLCTMTHTEKVDASVTIQMHDKLRQWLSEGTDHHLDGAHLVRKRTEVVWCLHIPDLIAFVQASEYPIILEEEHEGWITLEIYDARRE